MNCNTTHYRANSSSVPGDPTDAKARAACIAHHGTACSVCGFDFAQRYGEHGEGFIEVHHLEPLADRDGSKRTDPVADLRPLCANCHAMIHRKGLMTPEQLKTKLRPIKTR